MRLRAGGFLWLLAHDLRQSRRSFFAAFGKAGGVKIAAIMASVIVTLHLIAAGVVAGFAGIGPDGIAAWFAAGALATLTWMVAQGVTGAMRSIYARGDFDLLFASPISPLSVLASRALAIAAEGAASALLLLARASNAFAPRQNACPDSRVVGVTPLVGQK